MNKLDPAAFRIADISQTSVCPLARIMRRELKKRGIEHLKVVYSLEKPHRPVEDPRGVRSPREADASCAQLCGVGRRDIPGAAAFVPSVAGLMMAGEVVRDLVGI